MQRAIVLALEEEFEDIELQSSMAGTFIGRVRGWWASQGGNRVGWPDIFVAEVGHNGQHGLCLEVKAPNGRLRDEQRARLRRLHSRGYAVDVVRSVDDATQTVQDYLQPWFIGEPQWVAPPLTPIEQLPACIAPPPRRRRAAVQQPPEVGPALIDVTEEGGHEFGLIILD